MPFFTSCNSGSLQADLDTANNQITSLNSQLSSVQSQLTQVQTELGNLQEVFPPRDFSSSNELQEWLNNNNVSTQPISQTYGKWYAKALQVQLDALNDGYIVSVDIDYYPDDDSYDIWNVAVVDGYMWYWDPETDMIYQDTAFGQIGQ